MANADHRAHVASRIAFMPQGLGKNLYPSLPVAETVDFFASLYATSAVERGALREDLLIATGLDPFANRPAGKLSGGMKQKLSLCCALVHDPDLLILGEPTTGVDPILRRQFWELIDRIRTARPGLTLLVAKAYMEEAKRFNRLVAMDAGRILASGPLAEAVGHASARSVEEAYVTLRHPDQRSAAAAQAVPPRGVRRAPCHFNRGADAPFRRVHSCR
jgi:ribosome-dependent ATPase